MKRFILPAIVLILILALSGVTGTLAQGTDREVFRQTGHSVTGEFLTYYRSVPNATLLFGFPITEQFVKDGRLVQYFQRARFELRPDQPEGQRVGLTQLGRETYIPGRPAVGDSNAFGCRLQPTGYSICHSFLEFYDRHGGAAIFGQPISPFEYRDKMIVQYFENARFEWRPSMPEGQRVGITDLGRIYFDQKHEDVNLLKPVSFDGISGQAPLSIKSRAFAWKAVTVSTDDQLIYVIVQDQTLRPVSGATGLATIHWPGGRTETLSLITNSNGFGVVPLSFIGLSPGSLVTVEITVTINGLTNTTVTSFRIWY